MTKAQAHEKSCITCAGGMGCTTFNRISYEERIGSLESSLKITDEARGLWQEKALSLESRCSDQEHLLKDYDNMRRIVKWQGEIIEELKCCNAYAGSGEYGWDLSRLDALIAKIEKGQSK